MEIDERLEILCEEFAELEEAEKDYILGVSQGLAHSVSQGAMPPLVGQYKRNNTDTGLDHSFCIHIR
ncbi:MAG: hypothetical protein LBH44_13385 [Treponema sp.]|nr:hypothetical protein [Treponema sp.]